tara:strand:- start:359 stop:853 length:495 start_codon:yes stop_codon:yes gene_type:complete
MKSKIKTIDKIKDNSIPFIILIIFNLILTIIPPIIGLLWFNNLKKNKCHCSNTNIKWYVDYIVFYFIFIICYACISLLYLIIFRNKIQSYLISLLLFIYNIISYGIIVFYINQLNKKKDCGCANSIKKDFLYIWYFIKLILSSIFAFGFIVGILIVFLKNIKMI